MPLAIAPDTSGGDVCGGIAAAIALRRQVFGGGKEHPDLEWSEPVPSGKGFAGFSRLLPHRDTAIATQPMLALDRQEAQFF
jgi:hypothetical protein